MEKLILAASAVYLLSLSRRRNVLIIGDKQYSQVNYWTDRIDHEIVPGKKYDLSLVSFHQCVSLLHGKQNLNDLMNQIKRNSKIAYFFDFSEIGGVCITSNRE